MSSVRGGEVVGVVGVGRETSKSGGWMDDGQSAPRFIRMGVLNAASYLVLWSRSNRSDVV